MIEIKDLEEKFNHDGFIISDIKGTSMLPVLKEGINKVVIGKVNRDLYKYDVVLYKVKNKYILHRIIDINDDELVIRGDNCITNEYVMKHNVLGILLAYYDENGYIELTDSYNRRCYYRAKIKYILRKIKNILFARKK